MIPDPWVGVVLALAAYRLTRLGGWDDWPPIYRIRAWVIGERWISELAVEQTAEPGEAWEHNAELMRLARASAEVELPGKQPGSEVDAVRPAYDRPLLAHLVHCPFCLGWWISLAVYLVWLAFPTAALYIAAPFALSGIVGLLAKNLDA